VQQVTHGNGLLSGSTVGELAHQVAFQGLSQLLDRCWAVFSDGIPPTVPQEVKEMGHDLTDGDGLVAGQLAAGVVEPEQDLLDVPQEVPLVLRQVFTAPSKADRAVSE